MTLNEKEKLITQELEKMDPVLVTMLNRIKALVDELNRIMMDDSIDSNEKYFFLLNSQSEIYYMIKNDNRYTEVYADENFGLYQKKR